MPIPDLIELQLPTGWRLKHHRLFAITPDDPHLAEADCPLGFSVWDTYFLQDLVLAENERCSLMISVGWKHHAEPDGVYLIQLVGWKEFSDRPAGYDWGNPLVEFETRSTKQVVDHVSELARRHQ